MEATVYKNTKIMKRGKVYVLKCTTHGRNARTVYPEYQKMSDAKAAITRYLHGFNIRFMGEACSPLFE